MPGVGLNSIRDSFSFRNEWGVGSTHCRNASYPLLPTGGWGVHIVEILVTPHFSEFRVRVKLGIGLIESGPGWF